MITILQRDVLAMRMSIYSLHVPFATQNPCISRMQKVQSLWSCTSYFKSISTDCWIRLYYFTRAKGGHDYLIVQVTVFFWTRGIGIDVVQPEDILTHLIANLGSNQVKAHSSHAEFVLTFWLDCLPTLQADALGLYEDKAILINVKLPLGQHQPTVKLSTYGMEPVLHKSQKQPPEHKVLRQIRKICEAFIAAQWPCESEDETLTFLVRLYRHVQIRIPHLGRFCVVCGREQTHTGLKPVPCNSEACNHAFDEHGIGADLRDILFRPIVADLLITMASAACRCIRRRDSLFQHLPSASCLPTIDYVLEHSGVTGVSAQLKWARVILAFAATPSVATMATQSLQAGTENMRLIRSVLNSCQGHLMELQGGVQFPLMATEYQFWLCTDSPPKEAAFAQLKSQHGSQYLFHGSPFYNWHCILREGLKNMSGSSLMSTGQSHGPGIYLAEDSGISAQFCRYDNSQATPAYFSSIFGRAPQCIALCEVITPSTRRFYQGAGTTSNIYIVPDAQDIIVRYLFVYRGSNIPHVQASELREQCDRHTTMLTQVLEAVDKVSQEYQQPSCSSYSRCSDSAEIGKQHSSITEYLATK